MKKILTLLLQIVLALVMGTILPYVLGIGNGWEAVVIPLGMSLGIVLGGRVAYSDSDSGIRAGAVLMGTALGMLLLYLPVYFPNIKPLGFQGIILPLAIGLLTYYVAGVCIGKLRKSFSA